MQEYTHEIRSLSIEFNGHNHENNPSVFHCFKVKTAIKRWAYDTQVSTHNILTSSL